MNAIQSQNLLENADFEYYTTCPTGISEVYKSDNWFCAVATADFYNCSYVFNRDVPSGILAYSGKGFMGFLSYGDMNGSAEAIGQYLTKPLLPYTNYSISFAAKRPYSGPAAVDTAGVELYGFKDSIPYDTSFIHISQLPNSNFLGTSTIINNTSWSLYTWNFEVLDTLNVLVLTTSKVSCLEYIFIDDVSIMPFKISSTNDLALNNSFKIFPNPSDGIIHLILPEGNTEVSISDLYGKEINRFFSNEKTIDLKMEQAGIYFISVKSKTGIITQKVIVN